MTKVKKCFLISPIGEPDSDIRSYADNVRDFLRYEVVEKEGYVLERSDDDHRATTITDAMINSVIDSDLVIALLDFSNPNVYYELAVRHGSGKICVSIMSDEYERETNGRRVFDTQDVKDFGFPKKEMLGYQFGQELTQGLITFRTKMRRAIKKYEEEQYEILNPITRANRNFKLPVGVSAKDIVHTVDARLSDFTERLTERLNKMETEIGKVKADEILSTITDFSERGIATYIEGEEEAFEKLAAVTSEAKSELRTSRFAPQGISRTNRAFFDALCDFGKKKGLVCKRIMCMNHPDKVEDLWKTVNNTYDGSMQLFLTKRDNNFELVVVDDVAAFLHFYGGEERRIRSTLFIKGTKVVKEFKAIYDRMCDDADYNFWNIDCSKIKQLNAVHDEVVNALHYFEIE